MVQKISASFRKYLWSSRLLIHLVYLKIQEKSEFDYNMHNLNIQIG